MKKLWADRAWSRRIDEANRLVYNIDENGFLWIIACRGHYEDQHLNRHQKGLAMSIDFNAIWA